MSRRYLFGPVDATFADEHLWEHRADSTCTVFGFSDGTDVKTLPHDTWESFCGRLPPGRQPEFLVLYAQYRTIPPWLLAAPVPIVLLAGDANCQWHAYRHMAACCDLVLTDAESADRFRRAGIDHVRPAILFGGERSLLEASWPDGARDIDLLFVGNFQDAVQRARLPLLGRLAALRRWWNVVFATNVYGAEYRRLLGRSRIVFNRGIRGEWNTRVCEALAAGALLLQEAGNREVFSRLHDRVDCVAYTPETLVSVAEHYLEHEDERRAIAEAGRARVQEFSFGRFWQEQLDAIDRDWDELCACAALRVAAGRRPSLSARVWQTCPGMSACDPDLSRELEADTGDAGASCALGWRRAVEHFGAWPQAAAAALPHFQRAWQHDPGHVLAGLNLTEAIMDMGRHAEAVTQARQTLAVLESVPELAAAVLDAPHYRPEFDHFRVGWEQAAWDHAGAPADKQRAKRALLRWRLHLILGDLTGELAHYEAAAQAWPDLFVAQAALGCALARHGRIDEAIPCLQRAVDSNPFDRAAAQALFGALDIAGRRDEQEAFAAARRNLAASAPQLVGPEPWFADQPAARGRTFVSVDLPALHRSFGAVDTSRAACAFTVPRDAHVVLTLLRASGAKRILEIGTAAGHMTANLTEWSPPDAHIFSLGAVADLGLSTPQPQRPEDPPRSAFGAQANRFGKVHKVYFITADSLTYDFRRLAPLDFAFIDGAHDLAHVRSDSLKVYDALRPGGYLLWHDFGSPTPWVEVRQALEQLPFPEPIYHVTGTEVAFLRKQLPVPLTAEPVPSGAAAAAPRPLALVWEGDQRLLHSLALVNRTFCAGLLARGHELSLLPESRVPGESVEVPAVLAPCFHRPLSRPADVHIRQQWPPDFTPPPAGHWVVMQPWEFGSLPKAWVAPLVELVDEVWANTRYVRDLYVESGVPADRVHLVPLGVRVDQFRRERPPYPLQTGKRFRFLFVGGTIARKGIDLLLDAYSRAFRRADDVCLVIKDMGVGTFYRGQTAEARIAELQADPDAPEIEYLPASLSDDELAGLYTACSCLVHPYRGEGFGLPIAEAMASGIPAIVTGLGAALDFCTPENAFLIPARQQFLAERRVGDLETVGLPWLAEPDATALTELLRHAAAHPEEVRAKGERAAAHIRRHFTWEQAVATAEQRLLALRGRPVRRFQRGVARRADVSLCIIARNDERHLAGCLQSVADLVGQIVVVDSGSTDRTKEIAASFGATVVDFTWVDSFAAARNESLKHATGEWILWLDADERFDAKNRERLRTLLPGLGRENVVYFMRQSSVLEVGPHAVVHVDQPRLFRNLPGVGWRYRVHEQILRSLRERGADACRTEIVIEHLGYVEARRQGDKTDRNERLLRMELAEHPDDTFVLYNLGAAALTHGRLEEARGFFERCVANAESGDTVLPKVHSLLTRCWQEAGQCERALAQCRQARALFPADAELLFREALLLREAADLAGAEARIVELLALPRAVNLMGSDSGLQGYRARQFLAEIYHDQGRADEAAAQAGAALAECPDFPPALKLLADHQLARGEWLQLEQALAVLRRAPAEADHADLVQARMHLARRELDAARALLVPLVASRPGALWPKVILSYVLLQRATDPAAAEAVLRAILALDPGNAEAQHNLTALLSRGQAAAPGSDAVPPVMRRQRTSACLIVRNEEDNLPDCLHSLRDLFDEVIVVDTGSIDRTKEIADRFGAKVFDFVWVDSFAAARNECLRHATGDWIFWMDADDRLDDENRAKLRSVLDALADEHVGYVMTCRCLPDPVTQATTEVSHLRLFRNRSDVRWDFRVHEQILPAIKATGGQTRPVDVVIQHTGYQDSRLRARKLERDLRLLLLEHAERPDNPFIHFNLGQIYQEQGRLAEAVVHFRRSLELSAPDCSIVRKLYALLAQCHNQLDQRREAIAVCAAGRTIYPDDIEILFQEGMARRHVGDKAGAAGCWEGVLATPRGDHFVSLNVGIRGYLTRHNLALTYHDLGRIADAQAQWRAILEERPAYEPAWCDLAESYLMQQQWAELDQLADRLERQPFGKLPAALFRGRGQLARREFAAAATAFTSLINEYPTEIEPRLLLSYCYLQEGRDWDAAEKALTAVLELDPDHKEARHNLRVLYEQQGREVPPALRTSLAELFQAACARDTELNGYGPTLLALAKECRHVTDLGTQSGTSTTAFLYARPERLVCHARAHCDRFELLQALAGRTAFAFHNGGTLPETIEETDLLFLDLERSYDALAQALGRYSEKVRRYIVVPGTATFAEYGQRPGSRGLWPAVEELLAGNRFRLKERLAHAQGLAVLERAQ